MKRYITKLFLIVLIHIIWLISLIVVGSYGESTDKMVRAVSFFITEPIFILTIHIVLLYLVIRMVLKIKPVQEKERRNLLNISIVFTGLISLRVVFLYIAEIMLDGFSVFVYREYWGNILF